MNQPQKTAKNIRKFGISGEFWAVLFLRIKGYRIRARNFRIRGGEIDIIASRGQVVCFVEVKSRRSIDPSGEILTSAQQQRIRRTARFFLQANPGLADHDLRFDLILITLKALPVHLVDAWR